MSATKPTEMNKMSEFKSYSQAGQDLFAFTMTEGKTNGFYLDIGCNHESFHSNTYGLEQIGWTGLLVDIVGGCENRKGRFVKCDILHPTEHLLWAYATMPEVVDYFSLDVDDALLNSMGTIPLGRHTYRVITLEHDLYRVGERPQRMVREFLSKYGYQLVCGNVSVEGYGQFEDWLVHPDLVNPDLIKKYQCDGKDWREIMK